MTRLTDDDIVEIRREHRRGVGLEALAVIYRITVKTAYNIVRGYHRPEAGGPILAPKYRPRLTDQQIVDAKQAHDDGMTWVALGRLLGVDPAVVSRACRGKRRGRK